MPAMSNESDLAQYRITLFVGPESVEGKPFTQHCVFNVKKRSWKGGIQVAVEVSDQQLDDAQHTIDFLPWLTKTLRTVPQEDRASIQERAVECFIQAVCRCKLDVMLQSGISQTNQCLAVDTVTLPLQQVAQQRTNDIQSYILAELDLVPDDPPTSVS
jgi:hypothetical protein